MNLDFLGHKRLRNAATLTWLSLRIGAGETTLAVGLIFPLFICVRVWSRSEIPHTGRLMIPHQRLPLLLVLSIISLPSLPSLPIPGDSLRTHIRGMTASPSARREIEVHHSILLQMCSTHYKALVSSQAFLHLKHNQSLQHTH